MPKHNGYRALGWFKHGIPWNVRCNALSAAGEKAKPAITVFSHEDDRQEAMRLAIEKLKKYGYSNLTVDKIERMG